MSLYYVNDEGIARLRPIAADVELHMACTTLLTQTGWESDRQKTYGFIDLALMRAVLPHWTTKRLNRIAAVLVKLGAWAEAEGGYQAVGWDQEQRTKASRDGDAARAARARTKKKVRELFVPAAEISSLEKRRQTRFTKAKKSGFSDAVSNDNNTLEASVTRDVTPLPSSFSDLSSRDQGAAPPSAAPPPVISIDEERAKRAAPTPPKKRTRKKTPLDRAREQAVEIFNRHYTPRFGTAAWVGYNLLTPLASGFMRDDGTFKHEHYEQVVLAFLADPYWGQEHYGKPARGYGLDVLAFHRNRYDAQLARAATAQTPKYTYDAL